MKTAVFVAAIAWACFGADSLVVKNFDPIGYHPIIKIISYGQDTMRLIALGPNPDTCRLGEKYIDPGVKLECNFDTAGRKTGVFVRGATDGWTSGDSVGSYRIVYSVDARFDTIILKNVFYTKAVYVVDQPRTWAKPCVGMSEKPKARSKASFLLDGRAVSRAAIMRAQALPSNRIVTK